VPKSQKTRTRIETTVHDEAHRSNIPTTELGSFLSDQEKEPRAILYPRDPSLDPQLVWKGKDEQDQHPLEVPAVPIYIQEKIHPKALIEALRAEKTGAEKQLNLWGDFNGIQFEELVEFYQHEQNWSNRMILGDSLLVMTSLAEKEGLKGQVQMIYMDPPYGIKFGSNWQVSTRRLDVHDGRTEDFTRQPEQVKAFRDTWELGIHSYLTYLRDRLAVARDLLAESGSVFVQIGDTNQHLVRSVLDEVFLATNFIALIPFRKKTMPLGGTFIEQMDDFILWYAKRKEVTKYRPIFVSQNVEGDFHYQWAELPDHSAIRLAEEQIRSHALLPSGARVYQHKSLEPSGPMEAGRFAVTFEGREFKPPG
jgi:adenine-specific DNA-methyltransferase